MSPTLTQSPSFNPLSRARWGTALIMAALTLAALWTPLLQLPGYELAELLTLFNALAAGPVTFARVKQDNVSEGSNVQAALGSTAWLLFLDLLCVLTIALRAALGSRCSPFAGLPFLVVLPPATALLAPCLAAGISSATGRSRLGGWLYALALLALLAHGAWPAFYGPQAFGYDHLFGWVPGPLYDEALSPPRALWLFRALSLGLAGLCLLCLRVAPGITPVLFAVAIFATGPLEHRLGTRSSVADLDRALGATRSFDGLTVHAPRELTDQRLDELLRTAAIARAQVAEALGVPPNTRVDVFLHRSSAEKAILTGAGQTHFTKPWLGQIQTEVDAPRILRHELVHALAASVGGGVFGVGEHLYFNIGIIEGLAEAVDWPVDSGHTLFEWTAGMKAAGVYKSPSDILGSSAQFYGTSQDQAYTVAGAFLHWMLEAEGRAAVQALYKKGRFEKSGPGSLEALTKKFEESLATVVVSSQLEHAARERYRVRPFFSRPCGREVAGLNAEAQSQAQRGDLVTSAKLYGRCAALDPGEPRYLEARWLALRAAHDPGAEAAMNELLTSPAIDDALRARVAVARGTQDAIEGQLEDAAGAYAEAQELGLDPPSRRAVEIRIQALKIPDLTAPLRRAFDEDPDDLALLALSEAANAHPLFAPLPYLIGLRLAAKREWKWAQAELATALDLGLPDDLAAQALRVSTSAALSARDYDKAAASLSKLRALPLSPSEQVQLLDLTDQVRLGQLLFPSP